MNSTCEPEFWELYQQLPEDVRRRADKAFGLWKNDPTHQSLRFKPIPGHADVWSARVTKKYRALCIRDGQNCHWFFIGCHEDYDRLVD